ncbi:molybdenum ABC transporter substrate-binding protein [Vreelandella aquamarina]|jgi:molybdate transport system substrate-binding protein|uniref:molybdate ABC transporter substrate-binding protein n=1 Tax=Vreelandella aquamarina TaxID=77097 RepID=UPI0005CC535A|nr:molybdate ABC transporter substrate-binding protein [Halomonas meridiana]KJD20003.1 molybdenum ABC transporter substrate-binding protein [Halomonas meridiana]|tara:strand:+ start:679 stop:1446 length:768 start_codon:yes stop_codon:yes gene_type:complete
MRLLLLLCGWLLSAPVMAGAPIVAAASSLQFALEEAAQQFTQQTGQALRLNFGSSGNFRRQIAQGAPFELFLSANEGYVQALYDEGHVDDAGVIYARGRLAWVQPVGRYAQPDEQAPLAGVEEAIAALEEGQRLRIAIASPEHAPYGVAAQEVLQKAGLWETSEPLRVQGENVSQAMQFALSDEARGGLVAYSLAVAPALSGRSETVLIPETWHTPLRQRMVLTPQAGEVAHAFYEWLQQSDAKAIFEAYGFSTD